MFKRIVLLTILITNFSISAQNQKPERDAFVLSLAIDSVNYYKQEVLKSSYFVRDKILQIYPSEKIFIEAEIKADSIHSMTVVKENLNPEKTIIVEFIQKVENRMHDGMMLSVKNPFEKTLTYDALMFIKGGTKWIPTSIIPIRSKLRNFELWNDIILSLVMVEWKIK